MKRLSFLISISVLLGVLLWLSTGRGFPSLDTSEVVVFLGGSPDKQVRLPHSSFKQLEDVAVDTQKKQIYHLVHNATGLHLSAWDLQGQPVGVAVLPKGYFLRSMLHCARGELRAVVYSQESKESRLAVFARNRGLAVRLEKLHSTYQKYDESLDPVRARRLRVLLTQLRWAPPPRPGLHAFRDSTQLSWIDHMILNAADMDYAIAHSNDYRHLAFAWRYGSFGSFRAAIRAADGQYSDLDLRYWLRRLRSDGPPNERDFFNVKSLALRGNTLAVGGRIDDPERTRKVMWLELSEDTVKIIKASDGILAREL